MLGGGREAERDGMDTIILGLAESSIQLVPDGTLLLHIVVILAMTVVLNKTLFQPINKILNERDKQGKGTLAGASEIRTTIASRYVRYESALRAARAEGYRLAEVYRSQELRERDVQLTSIKSELASLIKVEKSLIEMQAEEARRGLAAETKMLALEIRGQILKPLSDFRGVS